MSTSADGAFDAEFAGYVGTWFVPEHGFAWREDLWPASWDEAVPNPGAWLVALPHQRNRVYPTMRGSGLLQQFRSLATRLATKTIRGDAEQVRCTAFQWILTYANRYGFLDLQSVHGVGTDGRRTFADGQPLSIWCDELLRFYAIDRAWRDVATLRGIGDGRPANRDDARERISRWFSFNEYGTALESVAVEMKQLGPSRAVPARWPAGAGVDEQRWVLVPKSRGDDVDLNQINGDIVRLADFWACKSVNDMLQSRASVAVLPLHEDRPMRIYPRTLLGAIYLRLADEMRGTRLPPRTCDHCGQPFIASRRHAKWCTPSCRTLASKARRVAARVGSMTGQG